MIRATLFFNVIFLGLPLAIISGNVFTIVCFLGAIVAFFIGLQLDNGKIVLEQEQEQYLAVNIPCLSPEWVDITTVEHWIELYLVTTDKIDEYLNSTIATVEIPIQNNIQNLNPDFVIAKQSSYSLRI